MIINENLIMLNLKAKSKEDAIIELSKLAKKEGKITSIDVYTKSVFDREKTYTTGVGNGIAIPHGKSEAVKEAMIVFGKTNDGIEWESLDGKPVNIIFLLGVPDKNVNNLHLKLLSQLSRKLMNEDFVES
ncbi:fructose PTS transporter subunit IIA [Thermoanaerobacterium sp. RBIITD]|uniref:PTS sugar transporter subunit IIA n=1 Tax=Thermoanaerobacterium sp. RBIITD TaxID=1550240 RepID=UPI000BB89D90|nr:fructose PTS transporter subunit IIA [Thermoanaerobacterium sp. RBIITD]SNX54325.1 PTS system IIA component, Fru family [Thermoanaerobacterium sp. RBIITD]